MNIAIGSRFAAISTTGTPGNANCTLVISLKKLNAAAGTSFTRWDQVVEALKEPQTRDDTCRCSHSREQHDVHLKCLAWRCPCEAFDAV